jgi:hypothetical protein
MAQTWIAKDGSTRKGKWYSKGTVGRHRTEEKELIASGTLPPATVRVWITVSKRYTDLYQPHNQVVAKPPAPKDKLPTALKVVRDEEDIIMEDDTS